MAQEYSVIFPVPSTVTPLEDAILSAQAMWRYTVSDLGVPLDEHNLTTKVTRLSIIRGPDGEALCFGIWIGPDGIDPDGPGPDLAVQVCGMVEPNKPLKQQRRR